MAAIAGDHSAYRNYQQHPASAYLAPSRYENYNLTDINKCVDSYYENQSSFQAENPPPYTDSPNYYSGVDTLPTLPETPSEADELAVFGDSFDNRQPGRFYGVNGVTSAPIDNIGYYSPQNQGAYYSTNENGLAGQYLKYHRAASDQHKMGSGSSVASSSESQKQSQKQKNHRRSSSSSDNGGFESGLPKPVLGVREKLRCSLDKIRPFRWNSSDKLSNNGSASKSKTKNNRRYSDSGAAFLSVNLTDSNKKKPGSRSGSASNDINRTLDSNISSTSKHKDKRSWKESLIKPYHSARQGDAEKQAVNSNSHDYVNITAINPRQFLHPPVYKRTPDNHTTKVERVLNDYYIASPASLSENSPMPRPTRLVEGKDTITRAKGTWNMLKTQKPKQIPIKASETYASYTTLLSASSDTLQSSDTAVMDRSDNADTSVEPPKLTPVSGQLLMDKNCGNIIVRPTAFKPVVTSQPTNKTSPLMRDNKWDAHKSQEVNGARHSMENSHLSKEDRHSRMSSESNNSDSGRLSVTSINAGLGNTAGSSFSCSGSEGYESARVSSSTNQSALPEAELNSSSDNNNKSLGSDDVMLENLESRMKEKESEIRLLRQSFEDNEKTLHKVYEDRHRTREAEFLEIKQKYSNQLKSQHRKSLQTQNKVEAQFRMLQEDQKRLIQTNNELQDRIQSMKDEIDLQSRQHEDIAELKARLEESEVELQQKHGEISHLKRQLKEKQAENSQRASEIVAMRGEKRDLCVQLSHRDNGNAELNKLLNERNLEIAELERRLAAASCASVSTNGSVGSPAYRGDSSVFYENHQPLYQGQTTVNDYYRDDQNYLSPPSPPQVKSRGVTSPESSMTSPGRDELMRRLHEAENRSMSQAQQFQKERRQWAEDKNKVIRYQKQLQVNYIQSYKRSSVLEREVKMLTAQLQSVGCEVPAHILQTPQETERASMCYPMEI